MKSTLVPLFAACSFLLVCACAPEKQSPIPLSPTPMVQKDIENAQIATFAGGCFWCIEAPFQELPGIIDAVSGYTGGTKDTASYSQVARGTTKHREAVQVTYDPAHVGYKELLEIFWRQIDPTDSGGQFADRGSQYTTAIYYHTEEQKALAESSKQDIEKSGKFESPLVTEILPVEEFYLAEEYHQDYYKKSSEHYQRYKKGSGRSDFIEDNWARDAALEAADEAEREKYSLSAEEIDERREDLDPLSYKVIAEEGTEKPFENTYWDNKDAGIYVDKVSGEPLYASVHKFESGTGWPSFWRSIDDAFIEEKKDWKLFLPRTELRSRYGDSHLGHVFSDGPEEHGGMRHCINSAALRFVPLSDLEKEGYGQYRELFE